MNVWVIMNSRKEIQMNNFIEKLKLRSPLIHNITNMVTINDVANIELACGARPIMAMAPQEMDEVTGICDGLNLNIGTPSEERFEAMRIAARMAVKKNIPIVLDMVGVGVSRFRMDFVMSLLDEVHVDVIKGNLSEVKAVMEHGRCDGGVEVTDTADESDAKALACRAALLYGCICVITGETDYVAELCDEVDCYDNNERSLMGTGVMDNCVVNVVASDADGHTHNYRVGSITGGHPMMKRVTGTGCMLSGLICAFAAAACNDKYGAVMAALSCMKSAGGLAASDMAECGRGTNSCHFIKPGNASYRDRLIDAVYHICDGDYELM